MPLDGSNNYYYPLGTPGVPNQTIESEKYNTFLDDLVMNDLNVPRPVSRGGTGASTPEQARTNLGVMASAGGPMTGSIIVTGSVTASTGPSAGTIYLGTDQTHYLQWNGTTYSMPNGPLTVGGTITASGIVTAPAINISGNGALGSLYVASTGEFGGIVTAPAINISGNGAFDSIYVAGAGSFGSISAGSFGNINAGTITASGVISGATITSTGQISASGNMSCANLGCTGVTASNVSSTTMTCAGQPVWHAGNFTPSNYVPLSGSSTISGALSVTGDIRAGHGTASGKLVLGNTGQNLNFNVTNSDGWRLQGGAGGFHIDTNAVKPGGGTWDAPSDGRVKTLLGEYEHGLEQITRLKPQRFKYTDRSFDLVKDREFIGFVAQDVEPVMPEMVRKKTGVIDGKEVQDFRMTDTSALIFALVNACKELAARVEELESAG